MRRRPSRSGLRRRGPIEWIGGRVTLPVYITEDARARDDLAAAPEAQRALREMKERHYADWPDQPLPALGGRSAREAVSTNVGRERVDALLKDIEFREAGLPPAERFDVGALRRALGL